MTEVLQMCRLQNRANITRMTTLTLLSLRNTEAVVAHRHLVIHVCTLRGVARNSAVLPV